MEDRIRRNPSLSEGVRSTVARGLMVFAALLSLARPGAVHGQAVSEGGSAPLSLSLEQALSLTVSANRDLERARLGLKVAEGQVSEAWGEVFPKVDLTGTYSRNLSPAVSLLPAIIFDPSASPDDLVAVQFGADNQWSNSISLEQPLFRASAFIGVGAASTFQAYQEQVVRTTLHEVVTSVRVLYYDLLLSQEQAGLIERSVGRVAQSLEETRALNRAGLAADYDVLRLEVELANIEPRARLARNQLARTERDLVTALDLPPGTVIEAQGSLAAMDLDDPSANTPENARILRLVGVEAPSAATSDEVARMYEGARTTNASVQQAALNVELRNTQVRLEQAEYLPQVSLFGSYSVQAQQNGGLDFFGSGNERTYGRTAGVRVTLPIFSGLQRVARVDQRRATLRSAELDRTLVDDRLRDDIQTALDEVEEARERARSQRLAVRQAQRGYEIGSAQYREGLGSQLELTDSEVALRQSEFNYAQAVYDYLSARARLDRAVGAMPAVVSGL